MKHLSNKTLKSWTTNFKIKKKFLNSFGLHCVALAIGIWGTNMPYMVAYFSLLAMFAWIILSAKNLEIGLTKVDKKRLTHRDLLTYLGAYHKYAGPKAAFVNYPVFLIGWFMLGAAILNKINI